MTSSRCLGVIADALIALAIQDDLERSRDRARILHHERDELAQDQRNSCPIATSCRMMLARYAASRRAKASSAWRSIDKADVGRMADGRETMQVRVAALVDLPGHRARSSRLVADAFPAYR